MAPPVKRAAAASVAALLVAAAVDRFLYGAVPRPEALYPAAAAIDSSLAVPLVLAVAGAGLLARRQRLPRGFVVGAAAAALVAVLLKAGVPAPRPYVSLEPPFPVPEDSLPSPYRDETASFPSLHATAFFAAAAAAREARREILLGAVAVASFVAYTRVLLYVHWTLDVAAGALLGWLCVSAAERHLEK